MLLHFQKKNPLPRISDTNAATLVARWYKCCHSCFWNCGSRNSGPELVCCWADGILGPVGEQPQRLGRCWWETRDFRNWGFCSRYWRGNGQETSQTFLFWLFFPPETTIQWSVLQHFHTNFRNGALYTDFRNGALCTLSVNKDLHTFSTYLDR